MSEEDEQNKLISFIEQHRNQLIAYIRRQISSRLGQKIEADDVLQEMAIAALQNIKEMKADEDGLFGRFCMLADQRIVDAHRRFFGAQKRSADREVPLGTPSGDSDHPALIDLLVQSLTTPSQAFSREQRHQKLWSALAQLSEEAQEALRLRYVSNLPTKEIAKRIGKTNGAARVLLTRSLRRLESLMDSQPTS